MFTGIIETVGKVGVIEKTHDDARFLIDVRNLDLQDVAIGESIAVNGVCLTVTALPGNGFWTDVSGETLIRTTLSALKTGSEINLEKSLLPTTRLGGHLVSGHVDGVGEVLNKKDAGRSVQFDIKVPKNLAKYIAEKGSICIDGVSLTINSVAGATLSINIIPHTLTETIIGSYKTGTRVNIEVDIVARYLERLLLGDKAGNIGSHDKGLQDKGSQGITLELLKEQGFTG